MSEIYLFKIHKARAEQKPDGGLLVELYYPDNPQPFDKRLPPNLEHGVQVFERLLSGGEANLATAEIAVGPVSAGSLTVLDDLYFQCHRRDMYAPSHKMHHSAAAGFSQSKAFVYQGWGIIETARRESGEEGLLLKGSPAEKETFFITNERRPWLVVPYDTAPYTIQAAERLGINLPYRYVNVELLQAPDTLRVYAADGTPLFEVDAFIEFLFETLTSINAMQIRKLPLCAEEVIPIDAEGMIKEGKFLHFNRESYLIRPEEIIGKTGKDGMPFGFVLEDPEVYQTREVVDGVPQVFRPEYTPPFYGPNGARVMHPHVFAPEDLLCRCLDGLGIPGFAGRWMEIELWKERSLLQGNSLLLEDLLAKEC